MPLTPEDRAALQAMAERADPAERTALARVADPQAAAEGERQEQTARVRELLGQIRERTGIR